MGDYTKLTKLKKFLNHLPVRESIDQILKSPQLIKKVTLFTENLYHNLDKEIQTYKPTCYNCKICCNFQISELTLFVSNIEFVYFLTHTPITLPPYANICPYISSTGCSIRPYRPIGCRIYFCNEPENYNSTELSEKYINIVKEFVDSEGIQYCYFPWLLGLEVYQDKSHSAP